MRPKSLVLSVLALLALALVAAGCGASNDESSTTAHKAKVEEAPKLSKAEFISQGDAICGEVNTAIGSVSESAAESSSQTTQIANLYIGMVQSLQRLGQPTETAGFSEFWGAAERLAMVEGEVKTAAESEEPAALEAASQEAAPVAKEFQSQAAVYGFEDCSEGPHAPKAAPESSAGEEVAPEESGGVESLPEEVAPEEEFIPEEEVAPEEIAPETGGAGGEIEEVAPEEEAPATGGESGGIGPG